MNNVHLKSIPRIRLVGVFVSTAMLMSLYEFSKEVVFEGALTRWESHSITIIMTATFATVASYFMRRWAVLIDEQLRIAAIAFEA